MLNNFVQQNNLLQQQAQQQTKQIVDIKVTVWVDQIDIDGNVLKTTALLPHTKTKILINAIIPDEMLKQRLGQATGQITLTVRGSIKPIDQATNSGQFDSRRFYALQQINATLNAAQLVAIQINKNPENIISWIHQARQKVLDYFDKLPKSLRYYGETLLLGYIRPDFYQDNQGIRELGLLHLFSISGFQVTMLISMITWLLGKIRLPSEITAILMLIILPMYYLFSGSIPSLIRAIIIGMLAQLLIIMKKILHH